ncbi:MAG: hypothetical protein AAGD13_23165 [Pseudomonadota bacterium]
MRRELQEQVTTLGFNFMNAAAYHPDSVTGQIDSGEKAHSKRQGLGDFEFVPWQIGATL